MLSCFHSVEKKCGCRGPELSPELSPNPIPSATAACHIGEDAIVFNHAVRRPLGETDARCPGRRSKSTWKAQPLSTLPKPKMHPSRTQSLRK
jgi:hypothetical protein